jgi:ABC-type hemin transport system substrate-binding protein
MAEVAPPAASPTTTSMKPQRVISLLGAATEMVVRLGQAGLLSTDSHAERRTTHVSY